MRRFTALDIPLFLSILTLVGMGIAFIYSASYPKAMISTDTGGDHFFYAGKQIEFALKFGLPAMLLCGLVPLTVFYRHPRRNWFLLGVLGPIVLMLIAVLFAPDVHGNRNRLGPIQPSEFARVAIILAIAAYLCRNAWKLKTLSGIFSGPAWLLGIPAVLLFLEKDLGTTFAVLLATSILLVAAGMKARYILLPLGLGLAAITIMVMTGHRAERIEVWLHPDRYPTGAGCQTFHSLIAIGSGGVFGRGFSQGLQKWSYVPAPQSDSIVPLIAEEMGFLLTVLFLFAPYMVMVFRGFSIAHRAPDEFSALVALGCTIMLGTQGLINLAVAFNVIPMMGVNLPFISYGGSSLMASLMMAGLLLNVSTMVPASPQMAAAGGTDESVESARHLRRA